MLIHKLCIEEDCSASLMEAEAYLVDICKEYDIDYTTCEVCNKIPITEGLLGKIVTFIKELFRKAFAILVKLWKMIVGFVRKVIDRIVAFFKSLLNKNDKTKTEVKCSIISNPSKVQQVVVDNSTELVELFKRGFKTFTSEIARVEKENLGYTKRLEQHSIKAVKESTTVFDVAKERVVYNKGIDLSDVHRTQKRIDDYKEKIKYWDERIKSYDPNDKWESSSLDELNDHKKFYEKQIKSEQEDLDEILNNIDKEAKLQGNDALSHYAVGYINILDQEMMKKTVMAENVCEAYNNLITYSLKNLKEYAVTITDKAENYDKFGPYVKFMNKIKRTYEIFSYSTDENDEELKIDTFPDFSKIPEQERAAAIQKWLQLRINWNQNIIDALNLMVQNNYEFFKLSHSEMIAMTKDISQGKLGGVKELLERNRDSLISSDHKLIDGRKFGLGVMVISDDMAEHSFEEVEYGVFGFGGNYHWTGLFDGISDFVTSDTAITYLTKYDLTIVAHGGDDDGKWTIERTRTPGGVYTSENEFGRTYVDDFIRQCIKEGFKRINLISCNPGHFKLPDDIQKNNKVLIRMSLSSTRAI